MRTNLELQYLATLAALFTILAGAMVMPALVTGVRLAACFGKMLLPLAISAAIRFFAREAMAKFTVATVLMLVAATPGGAATPSLAPRLDPVTASAAEPAFLRPAAACLKKPACRKEVADRLAVLGKRARKEAWHKLESIAEKLGQLHEAFERGKSHAEISERLDRIEKALAEKGRLTPEIAAELRAIRVGLDAAK